MHKLFSVTKFYEITTVDCREKGFHFQLGSKQLVLLARFINGLVMVLLNSSLLPKAAKLFPCIFKLIASRLFCRFRLKLDMLLQLTFANGPHRIKE